MLVFSQDRWFWIQVVLIKLRAQGKCFSPLILREVFSAFDKNPLEISMCEHKKNLSGFVHMGISVKADWVDHFQGFVEAIMMSSSLKTT
jgi:hypothetical protein